MKLMPCHLQRFSSLAQPVSVGPTAFPHMPDTAFHKKVSAIFSFLGFLAGLVLLVVTILFTAFYIGGFS